MFRLAEDIEKNTSKYSKALVLDLTPPKSITELAGSLFLEAARTGTASPG